MHRQTLQLLLLLLLLLLLMLDLMVLLNGRDTTQRVT